MKPIIIIIIFTALLFSCSENNENKLNIIKRDFQKELELLTDNQTKSLELYNKAMEIETKTNRQKVINYLSQSIELDESNHEAIFARGWIYNLNGEYDKGISDYNKYIKDLKELISCSKAYCNRGIIFWNNDQQSKAITDFNNAIKVAENDSQKGRALFFRGKLKFVLQDEESACEDWRKAGRLGFTKAYDQVNNFCK